MIAIIISLVLALFWALIAAGIAHLCHANVLLVSLGMFLIAFFSCILGMSRWLLTEAGQADLETWRKKNEKQ